MSSIWQNDGTNWTLLSPQGFPDEKTLHNLIEDGPHMLPLSGDPRMVIVGNEVLLNGNYADLVGIEPNGRLVVIEIKLKKNTDAKRAVIAQGLTYAASLAGMERQHLEQNVLGSYLIQNGAASLAEAVQSEDQSADFQADRFNEAVDQCLREGTFRLVFVLDEVPPELVRLVGYLESVTEKLTIDLIAVSSFVINGSQIVVPRRIDPEHDRRILESTSAGPAAHPASVAVAIDGTEAFTESIDGAAIEKQAALRQVAAWAQSLLDEGLAKCSTTIGNRRWILNVRLPDEPVGLVSIYNEGGAYICFFRSVFERRAPKSIARVEAAMAPKTVGSGNTTSHITDELLQALGEAYREAKRGVIKGIVAQT